MGWIFMPRSFQQLGIRGPLVDALKREGISDPTEIQEQTIPLILEGQDIMGQSETGTGKTLAFLLPILQQVVPEKKETQALILTPTYELAMQIQKEIELLTRNSGFEVTSAAIIGSANIKRQIEKLRSKQHIIVGSSGRILELIQKKKISSQTVKVIVIDEVDRLLDENNFVAVKAVLKTTLKRTQLLLFSATLPEVIRKKASDLLKNPQIIQVTDNVKIPPTIEHTYFIAEQRDKIEVLRKLIRTLLPLRALIFINKSEEIEKVVERLNYHGLKASGIHGEINKAERKQAIESFKLGRINLLVASDLAARGLDIKGITHIINLDLPEDLTLYLHRAGRTGRAGEEGQAISILTLKEVSTLKRLESSFNINITRKEMFQGRIEDPR